MKTLAELLTAHLDHDRSLNISRHTLRGSRYSVLSFLQWLASTHNIVTADHLRSVHLEAWQQRLSAHRTVKGLPLKPRM